MYGPTGRVPVGWHSITRRARESFMDGVMPGWLEVTETGAVITHFAFGADGTTAGWTRDRGILQVATAATNGSRATVRSKQLVNWQSFTAIHTQLRTFNATNDTATRIELALLDDAAQNGIELRQNAAETSATMRIYAAGVVTTVTTRSELRSNGPQSIGLSMYPRTGEWAVTSEDAILAHGVTTGWNWGSAVSTVMLRARASVQALAAASKLMSMSDFAIELESF
jgi:hypothetical protein